MGTERLEQLLEELIEQNKATNDSLQDIVTELKSLSSELNWIETNSFAKTLLESIEDLGKRIDSVESAIGGIDLGKFNQRTRRCPSRSAADGSTRDGLPMATRRTPSCAAALPRRGPGAPAAIRRTASVLRRAALGED